MNYTKRDTNSTATRALTRLLIEARNMTKKMMDRRSQMSGKLTSWRFLVVF